MAMLDKPLAYLQNLGQPGAGVVEESSSPPAFVKVRVEVKGFPPSAKALEPGNYTLGSSPECDLIIPEAPADEIALLHVRGGTEPHELVSMSRGIMLGGKPFNPQTRVSLLAETVLEVGPAKITFIPRVNKMQRAGQMLAKVNPGASFKTPVTMLLIAAALGLVAWYSSGSAPTPIRSFNFNLPERPSGLQNTASTAPITNAKDTSDELNRLFNAADLSSQIEAKTDGTQVTVQGAISMGAEPRMNEIMRLVGTRSNVPIKSMVRPDSSTLIEAIAGVSLQPSRYIILTDGERYRVGDLMPNGWSVESIDQQQVIVTRDGLRETLDLGK